MPISNRPLETTGSGRKRRTSRASSARRPSLSRRPSSSRCGSGSTPSGWTQFDVYPFILLNLAFSTQAAYAAPLILLAQTRQADRDKVTSLADAQHREELHQISEQRQEQMREQAGMLIEMMQQNTTLTERVETLLQAKHRTHGDGQDPRRADRRHDHRGPCAPRAGPTRLSGPRPNPPERLLVDELDRLLECGGRNLEQACVGHAEFEDEKDRKRDRQGSESQRCDDQRVRSRRTCRCRKTAPPSKRPGSQ